MREAFEVNAQVFVQGVGIGDVPNGLDVCKEGIIDGFVSECQDEVIDIGGENNERLVVVVVKDEETWV